MRRPIAEILVMSVKGGSEAQHSQDEREMWQILRRKPGYVTHRTYEERTDASRRLAYSEWESKKALDGARQHLNGTPLMRRARGALGGVPQRLVAELTGAITSTKGLDLAAGAVAACAVGRLVEETPTWREHEGALSKTLSAQPGHVTHVLFRGFGDPLMVGSLSHWTDAAAFDGARPQLDAVLSVARFAEPLDYILYAPLRD